MVILRLRLAPHIDPASRSGIPRNKTHSFSFSIALSELHRRFAIVQAPDIQAGMATAFQQPEDFWGDLHSPYVPADAHFGHYPVTGLCVTPPRSPAAYNYISPLQSLPEDMEYQFNNWCPRSVSIARPRLFSETPLSFAIHAPAWLHGCAALL